eukprot:scaffold94193_cov63-Phaeocystis_antarctica.AAC.4
MATALACLARAWRARGGSVGVSAHARTCATQPIDPHRPLKRPVCTISACSRRMRLSCPICVIVPRLVCARACCARTRCLCGARVCRDVR